MREILLRTAGNNREQKVIQAIETFNQSLSPSEKKEKYGRMSESAFRFYRGTNHLFWMDFAGDWHLSRFGNQNTRIWVQGDAHLENFGAFMCHQTEDLVYGLNDFDDAVIADYQYDVWRFATSLVLASKGSDIINEGDCQKAVETFAHHYLQKVIKNDPDELTIFYTKDNTQGKLQKFLEKVEDKSDRQKMLNKWTKLDKGGRIFDVENEKLTSVSDAIREKIILAIRAYRNTLTGKLNKEDESYFRVKDVAVRLGAGTGSLGTDRYYVLIEGHDGADNDHILDVKQQGRPTPYLFLSLEEQQEYQENFTHDAERHAVAYIALSDDPDDYLGWMELEGLAFSVRERSPFKKTFPLEKLKKGKHFVELASQWGEMLATEHRRGAQKLNADSSEPFFEKEVSLLVEGREKDFVELVVYTANHYAEQVEHDFQFFQSHRKKQLL